MTLHYRAEGRYSYAVLLFVPSTKPFDLFEPARKGRVKLYVRRVFITDDADLLPAYLRFMRGVVDSEDLPLNISREMLQNNPQLAQIRKAVTSRVIGELETLGGEGTRDLRQDLGRLRRGASRKASTRTSSGARSCWRCRGSPRPPARSAPLKQYVADLKPNQTEIYFLVGDSIERLKSNPQLEAARARGIEVLLLTDPVDAFWTSARLEFEGKPLKSLSQGDLNFDLIPLLDENKDKAEPAADEAATIAIIKASLGERVTDVKASTRLTDQRLLPGRRQPGPDRELERLLSQQNRGMRHQADPRDQHAPSAGVGDRGQGRRQGHRRRSVAAAAGAGADPRRRSAGRSRRLRRAAQPPGAAGVGWSLTRRAVIPGWCVAPDPESRDSQVRNCAP